MRQSVQLLKISLGIPIVGVMGTRNNISEAVQNLQNWSKIDMSLHEPLVGSHLLLGVVHLFSSRELPRLGAELGIAHVPKEDGIVDQLGQLVDQRKCTSHLIHVLGDRDSAIKLPGILVDEVWVDELLSYAENRIGAEVED